MDGKAVRPPARLPDHTGTSAAPSRSPEAELRAALSEAGPQGVSIADLVHATGKGRTWVYEGLR